MGERLQEAAALNEALLKAHDSGDMHELERAWVLVSEAVDSFHVAAGAFDALLARFMAMEEDA